MSELLKLKAPLLSVSLAALLPLLACGTETENDSPVADPLPPSSTLTSPELKYVPGEVLIQYESGPQQAARSLALERLGVVVKERVYDPSLQLSAASASDGALDLAALPEGLSVADAIDALKGVPGVHFVEPNYLYQHQATSTDTYYTNGSLWGLYGDATSPANVYGSQAGEAWALGHTGSRSIVVGIIDEGVQIGHPDLDANIWTNPYDPVDGVDNDGNGFIDDTNEVIDWLDKYPQATPEQFIRFLREIYKRPDMLKRFPRGF